MTDDVLVHNPVPEGDDDAYNVSADATPDNKKIQRVKLAYSADGADTHVQADADGLLVNVSNASIAATLTEPVSVDDNGGSLTVDGTVAVSGTVDVSGSTVSIDNAGDISLGAVEIGPGFQRTATATLDDTEFLDVDAAGGSHLILRISNYTAGFVECYGDYGGGPFADSDGLLFMFRKAAFPDSTPTQGATADGIYIVPTVGARSIRVYANGGAADVDVTVDTAPTNVAGNYATLDGVGFHTGQVVSSGDIELMGTAGYVWNGSGWYAARGDATNGLDVDVTRSALPSGASTSANQTTIIGHLDGVEGLLTTIDGDTGTIAGAVAGSEMQVDVVTLPSVTIGALPDEGQQTMANSISVAIASNQSAVAVDASGTTVPISHAALTELAAAIDTEVQVDIVSSALPTGAATSAKQDTIIGHVDGIEGLLTTIDADTGALAGAVSGSEVQVDVVTLPNVTIGAAIPAGTNNIGDVDVLTTPKAGTATLSNVNDTASSTTLLSANANRVGAMIWNDSSSVLYVKFGTTASATSCTVKLVADAYFEFPEPCYTGRVDGIWASDSTGAARITEMTA